MVLRYNSCISGYERFPFKCDFAPTANENQNSHGGFVVKSSQCPTCGTLKVREDRCGVCGGNGTTCCPANAYDLAADLDQGFVQAFASERTEDIIKTSRSLSICGHGQNVDVPCDAGRTFDLSMEVNLGYENSLCKITFKTSEPSLTGISFVVNIADADQLWHNVYNSSNHEHTCLSIGDEHTITFKGVMKAQYVHFHILKSCLATPTFYDIHVYGTNVFYDTTVTWSKTLKKIHPARVRSSCYGKKESVVLDNGIEMKCDYPDEKIGVGISSIKCDELPGDLLV